MKNVDLQQCIWEAQEAEVGVAVQTDNPTQLVMELMKPKFKDIALNLGFTISPENPSTEVWIYKRDKHAQVKNAAQKDPVSDERRMGKIGRALSGSKDE